MNQISWEDFQREYLTRKDEYKYEWLDGIVEKTKRTMNYQHIYISVNLQDALEECKEQNSVDGWFTPAGAVIFGKNHREPYLVYYSKKQIREARYGKDVIPQFVIEVISDTDRSISIDKKMKDYEAAQIPVVWHILPQTQRVHVYNGKKMVICEDSDICSAESVIKGFKIKASDIFK